MGRVCVHEARDVQDTTICWQGDGHSILGRKTRCHVRLFTQEKYNKGVLLQQDNARVYSCKDAMNAVERNRYKLIPHPAYSPDLAPRDFFLFPNMKRISVDVISGRTKKSAEEWVNGKDPDFFSSGLMALEHRWSKCITLVSNYLEKEKMDLNRK